MSLNAFFSNLFGAGHKKAATPNASRSAFDSKDLARIDLTHFQNQRIIALGYPNDKPQKDGVKNNAEDVQCYLRQTHSENFMVWNINDGRPDQAAACKRLSDRLYGQVLNIPWDTWDGQDGGSGSRSRCSTPPLAQLIRICYSIQGWLELNSENIAVITCRSDQRTSILIACYLRFCRQESKSLDAYLKVSKERYDNATKATSDGRRKRSLPCSPILPSPSLKMLFTNFDIYMNTGKPPFTPVLSLLSISMENLPVDEMPRVDIWNKSQLVYSSSTDENEHDVLWNSADGVFFHKVNERLCGDFVLVVRFNGSEPGMSAAADDVYDDKHILFRYTNCTGFIDPNVQLRISRNNIDINRLYVDGFEESFNLSLMVETLDGPIQEDQYYSDAIEPLLKTPQAVRQGLLDIATFHTRVANMKRLDKLLTLGFSSESATLGLQLAGNNVESARKLIQDGLQAKLDAKSNFSPMSSDVSSYSPTTSPMRGVRKGSSVSTIRYGDADPAPLFTPASARSLVQKGENSEVEESKWDKPVKCSVCGENDPSRVVQLLECMTCCRKFHAACVGEDELPFLPSSSIKDQIRRDTYVNSKYSDWQCRSCLSELENGATESTPMPTWAGARKMSGALHRKVSKELHRIGSVRRTSIQEGPPDSSESEKQFFPSTAEPQRRSSQLLQRQGSKRASFSKSENVREFNKVMRKASIRMLPQEEVPSPRARSESHDDLRELLKKKKSVKTMDVDNESILEVAGKLREDGIEGDLEALQEAFKHSRSRASYYGSRPSLMPRKSMFLDVEVVGDNSSYPQLDTLDSPDLSQEEAYDNDESFSTTTSEACTPERPSKRKPMKKYASTESMAKKVQDPLNALQRDDPVKNLKLSGIAENFPSDHDDGEMQHISRDKSKVSSSEEKTFQSQDSSSSVETAQVLCSVDDEQGATAETPNRSSVSTRRSTLKISSAEYTDLDTSAAPMCGRGSTKLATTSLANLFSRQSGNCGDSEPTVDESEEKRSEMTPSSTGPVSFSDSLALSIHQPEKPNTVAISNATPSNSPPEKPDMSAITEMVSARIPQPLKRSTNALSDMLAARSHNPAKPDTSALQSMPTARNPPAERKDNIQLPRVVSPKSCGSVSRDILKNCGNDAIRPTPMSPSRSPRNSVEQEVESTKGNHAALSAMLGARAPPSADAKNSALAAMLASRAPPSADAKNSALSSMLASRAPPSADAKNSALSSMLAKESESGEVKQQAPVSETPQSGVPALKDDPRYSKFFKMLKAGVPRGAVAIKMQAENCDPAILDMDPEKPAPAEKTAESEGVPLNDDPRYSKFFKMLKAGVPRGAVEIKISAEGLDPKVLDMDPAKPAPDAQTNNQAGVPLKDDPNYAKFFKMLKAGVPRGAVEVKLTAEGLDPKVLDMDPEKPHPNLSTALKAGDAQKVLKDDDRYVKYFNMLKSGSSRKELEQELLSKQLDPEVFDMDFNKPPPDAFGWKYTAPKSNVPLKDDPQYGKFFKMLKAGVPRGAVEIKVSAENLDPKVLDMDPEKPMQDPNEPASAAAGGPPVPLKDDLKYGKFFKMLKAGVPRGAVEIKMSNENLDPKALDMDPEKPYADPGATAPASCSQVPLKDDEKYAKFFKMLKAGVPRGAVEVKMTSEGLDSKVLDMDLDKPSSVSSVSASSSIPLKDDERYAKFFKMLKAGVPRGAVEAKMRAENLDAAVLDMDPEKPAPDASGSTSCGPVAAKDDPRYSKFFKMFEEGTPRGAVRQLIAVAGLVPHALDSPNAPAPAQEQPVKKPNKIKIQKPKEKRRKLHWTDIPKERVMRSAESVWVGMESFNLDVSEIENLFVEKLDKVEPAKEKEKKEAEPAKPQKISLLDGKRAMNCAIAIARVKMSFSEIRDTIMFFSDGLLNEEQLIQLMEFMPTEEEETKLLDFKKNDGRVDMLGEAEKFMLEMCSMTRRTERMEAMIFKEQFAAKIAEIKETAELLKAACYDVKISVRLKKLLSIILKLGNELNQKSATGFTLESLLKLNAAKAFDKKTSILHYLVMLADRNDRSLLKFKEDLKHVFPASRVMISQLQSDLSDVEKNFSVFRNVVLNDPNLRPAGMLSPVIRGREEYMSPKKNVDSPGGSLRSQVTGVSEARKSIKMEKLERLSQHRSVNRTTMDNEGRMLTNFDLAFANMTEEQKKLEENRKVITDFMKKVEDTLQLTRELLNGVELQFMNVLDYFGEDPEMPPDKFFKTLHSFILAFDEACVYVERQKKIKERERKLAEKKQKEIEARLSKPKKRLEKVKEVPTSPGPGWRRRSRASDATPCRLPSAEEAAEMPISAVPSKPEPPVVLSAAVNAKVLKAMESNSEPPPEPKAVGKESSPNTKSPQSNDRKHLRSPRPSLKRSQEVRNLRVGTTLDQARDCLEASDSGVESDVPTACPPLTPTEQEEMNEWKEESLPEPQLDYAAKEAGDSPELQYAEEL